MKGHAVIQGYILALHSQIFLVIQKTRASIVAKGAVVLFGSPVPPIFR
jgi:hypothetical protein